MATKKQATKKKATKSATPAKAKAEPKATAEETTPTPKATPEQPSKKAPAKAPGVLAKRTRPYFAGRVIKQHGLAAGVTDAMMAELDEAYGTANPRESFFLLKMSWHICRGYAGVAEDATE